MALENGDEGTMWGWQILPWGIVGCKSVGPRSQARDGAAVAPRALWAGLLTAPPQAAGSTAGLQAGECPDGSDDNNDGADNSLLLRVFIALSQGALLLNAGSASQMLPN